MTIASLLLALFTATSSPASDVEPSPSCSTSTPNGADRATRCARPSSN